VQTWTKYETVLNLKTAKALGLIVELARLREGELCGPGYRWTYAQPKFSDSDLTCEPE
jgi:hypothetical protein